MKKMYKRPATEMAEMMPQSIICGSFGEGPDAPENSIGE